MLEIRRLHGKEAEIYRSIRLEGLERHPEAFGASFDTERAEPLAFFARRLAENAVFGAFDNAALQGVAGYFASKSVKESHKATLFGMYVRDAAHGQGVGQRLVTALLADAARSHEDIKLTVVTANEAARRLYERCGFECYGIEPRSLKVGNIYYDEALMHRRLGDDASQPNRA